MVTRFWIDSEAQATTNLCARLHVEADIWSDSFEILEIWDEDTRTTLQLSDLDPDDLRQIFETILDKMTFYIPKGKVNHG